MAVSITQRPATWSAVKNPVVYKFSTTGGPFTNYRIEVQVFNEDTDAAIGPVLSFSPDPYGNTIADISEMLKAVLKTEWEYESSLYSEDSDSFRKFYIKFQEKFDTIESVPLDDTDFDSGWISVDSAGLAAPWTFGSGQAIATMSGSFVSPRTEPARYELPDMLETGNKVKVKFTLNVSSGQTGTMDIRAFDGTNVVTIFSIEPYAGAGTDIEFESEEITLPQNMSHVQIRYNHDSGSYGDVVVKAIEIQAFVSSSELLIDTDRNVVMGGLQIPSPTGNDLVRYVMKDNTIGGPSTVVLNDSSFESGWSNDGDTPGLEWAFGSGEAIITTDSMNPDSTWGERAAAINGTGVRVKVVVNISSGQTGGFGVNLDDGSVSIAALHEVGIIGDGQDHEYSETILISNPFNKVKFLFTYESGSYGDVAVKSIEVEALSVGPESKFLSRMDRPKLWRGFPFSLSVIADASLSPFMVLKEFAADGQQIGSDHTEGLNIDGMVRVSLSEALVSSDAKYLSMQFQYINDYTDPTPVTEELFIDVENNCKNPIMLFWKNSLGGDSCWLFEIDQEVSYSTSGGKFRKMRLSTGGLTANQWEALNELIHLGEVYRENIQELTSGINKTHIRDGSQVYVVDPDGTKTGVIVRTTNNAMFTRMMRHEFTVEIEYPEIVQ